MVLGSLLLKKICKDAGISESKRVKDLVDQELITLRSLIEKITK